MANMDRWQEHIGPLDDLTLSQLKRAKNILGAFIKSVDKEYIHILWTNLIHE